MIADLITALKTAYSGFGVPVLDGPPEMELNDQTERQFITIAETTADIERNNDAFEVPTIRYVFEVGVYAESFNDDLGALSLARTLYEKVLDVSYSLLASQYQTVDIRGQRNGDERDYAASYTVEITVRVTRDMSQCV